MKIDPYRRKEYFIRWITSIDEKGEIDGLNKINSHLFISFIKDLRLGLNISAMSKKGERSYGRLCAIKSKLGWVLRQLQDRGVEDIRRTTAADLHQLFYDMRSGLIRNKKGLPYKSAGDYTKDFKAFWHWHQKVLRKKGVVVEDVTEDLDRRGEKPKFVYFTIEDFERMLARANYDLKPIISLAFDSGMRVTELINTKVSDFSDDFRELNIRNEVSKTFGRRIKLMLCSSQIKEYVRLLNLSREDYLFKMKCQTINIELRKLGKAFLTEEQTKFKSLSLYDFRHSSACFWLPRYKSETAMMYRFGWKKSDMIHYYTEFMGMKDTINDDDMYLDVTKTDLEKEVESLRKELAKMRNIVKQVLGAAEIKGIISS